MKEATDLWNKLSVSTLDLERQAMDKVDREGYALFISKPETDG